MPRKESPIRIAIVSDFYLDFVGGAQSSIFEQRAALESAGHTVFLIANARLGRAGTEGTGGLSPGDLAVTPAFTIPGLILPIAPNRPKLVEKIKTFLVENAVDVVHLQSEFGLAHAATTAAHELAKPVVQTVHTFYWESEGLVPTILAPVMRAGLNAVIASTLPRIRYVRRPSDNLLRNLTVAMTKRSDVVVSPSAHQAADLAAAGVHGPIHVIPNPIARSPRAATLLSADEMKPPKLLWVARCESVKRPLVFARAVLEALERTNNGFEVDFVGDGAELHRLRRLVAGHPQIRVHGAKDHDMVMTMMDAAAIVALTSYDFDNQPMIIAEAVNRYRGVLYCDPALSEGLTHSGFLSATPDAHGLANAVVEVIDSPAIPVRLSAGAKRDAATFSAATYVQRITDAYRAALG